MRALFIAFVVLGAVATACASSPTKYQVIVHFNASVTQADMDDVAGYLHNYDQGLDFLTQETFPPTGVATLRTNAKHFCRTVEAELEARSYIDGVDCRKANDVTPSKSPDAPVGTTP
jgi:hypothetical protein